VIFQKNKKQNSPKEAQKAQKEILFFEPFVPLWS
jgi:hypothetical protein